LWVEREPRPEKKEILKDAGFREREPTKKRENREKGKEKKGEYGRGGAPPLLGLQCASENTRKRRGCAIRELETLRGFQWGG